MEDRLSLPAAANPSEDAIIELLESRGVEYTTWEGWKKLDAHEIALGAAATPTETSVGPVDRARIKVVERDEMVKISRA